MITLWDNVQDIIFDYDPDAELFEDESYLNTKQPTVHLHDEEVEDD